MPSLQGYVCLVTGASRSIGRGVALQLASEGALCYITGRNSETLAEVVTEAEERNFSGKLILMVCDHACDEQVKQLFKTIESQNNGRLDLLVNNAFAASEYLVNNTKVSYWDLDPIESWDVCSSAGLRNNFICATLATRLMLQRRSGLIVNISSIGGLSYSVSPTYGIAKAANDRMAKDCAVELQGKNITFLSLWPSVVRTKQLERFMQTLKEEKSPDYEKIKWLLNHAESAELIGSCVARLIKDPDVNKYAGKIVLTEELANKYGLSNEDGSHPASLRSFKAILAGVGLIALSDYVPAFLKIPKFLFLWLLSVTAIPQEKLKGKYE